MHNCLSLCHQIRVPITLHKTMPLFPGGQVLPHSTCLPGEAYAHPHGSGQKSSREPGIAPWGRRFPPGLHDSQRRGGMLLLCPQRSGLMGFPEPLTPRPWVQGSWSSRPQGIATVPRKEGKALKPTRAFPRGSAHPSEPLVSMALNSPSLPFSADKLCSLTS